MLFVEKVLDEILPLFVGVNALHLLFYLAVWQLLRAVFTLNLIKHKALIIFKHRRKLAHSYA